MKSRFQIWNWDSKFEISDLKSIGGGCLLQVSAGRQSGVSKQVTEVNWMWRTKLGARHRAVALGARHRAVALGARHRAVARASEINDTARTGRACVMSASMGSSSRLTERECDPVRLDSWQKYSRCCFRINKAACVVSEFEGHTFWPQFSIPHTLLYRWHLDTVLHLVYIHICVDVAESVVWRLKVFDGFTSRHLTFVLSGDTPYLTLSYPILNTLIRGALY